MSDCFLSPLILGFWRLKHWQMNVKSLREFVTEAADLGITTMDHAMVYRSEALFGEMLAATPELRHRLQIVSKCGIRPQGFGDLGAQNVNHYDFSAAYTRLSVEASLRDLQVETIDLLLLHRPDYLMDVAEVAETFSQLRSEGKVRHFGVSNFTPSQVELLQSALPEPLVTNQIECSPLCLDALENGIFDQAQQLKMRPMLWSCLAGGRLLQPETAREQKVASALAQVAKEQGTALIEAVAYAWLLRMPSQPHPILGTGKIERVRTASKALELKLTREQWYHIWEASNGAAVP